MPLRYKTTTQPRVVKTDKWEIHIYPEDCIVKFWKRTIYMDELTTAPRPAFVFYTKDFQRKPDILDILITYLQEFRKELR